jgi:hypothetical protein
MGLFMLTDDLKGAIVSNKVENFQRNERECPHGSKKQQAFLQLVLVGLKLCQAF